MTDDWKDQMLRHVQITALGFLTEYLLADHLRRHPDPNQASEDLRVLLEAIGERMTFDGVSPEMSDVAAQEFRDTLVRHLERARALATGEPFDPESFQRRSPGPPASD